MPDAAENLPDGTDPTDPPGSFPHIPYYAIGCTLQSIVDQSDGRMTLDKSGASALGRDMYVVTLNALDTPAQQRSYARLQRLAGLYARNPRRGQQLIERRDAKVPLFIQSGIHGNEYEGVDASMRFIERLATTPYGTDPEVDAVLDHAVVVFHVIQNPDGRIAGMRTNGNGFDLNRDYITQSQPEAQASVDLIKSLPFTQVLDLHGYVAPTLLEATTVPHNPGIEYDIWLKWNQPRLDANQDRLASEGFGVSRPINNILDEWIPEGETLPQGWDDWGPFYTGQYGQLRGLDAQTIEMCDWDPDETEDFTLCGINGVAPRWSAAPARCARRSWPRSPRSTFAIENRREMMYDQFEIYRRGVDDAARVRLTDPAARDRDPCGPRLHDRLPAGARDPGGQRAAQRRGGEAAGRLPAGQRHRGQPAAAGLSLRRAGLRGGLVRRADRPGPARSRQHHAGRGRRHLRPRDRAVRAAGLLEQRLPVGRRRGDHRQEPVLLAGDEADRRDGRGRGRGAARPLGLVRARGRLAGPRCGPSTSSSADGVTARLATEQFETRQGDMPAGSVLFTANARADLRAAGREAGLWFEPVRASCPRVSRSSASRGRVPVLGLRELGAGGAARLLRRPLDNETVGTRRQPIRWPTTT